MPRIRLLTIDTDDVPEWYEIHDYRRLVDAAAKVSARIHLMVKCVGIADERIR